MSCNCSVWDYKVLLMTCKCTSLSRIFETLTLHSELIFRLLLQTSSYPTTSSTLIKASEHMVNKFLKTCFSNLKFRTELVKHFNIYGNSDNTFRVWFNPVNVKYFYLMFWPIFTYGYLTTNVAVIYSACFSNFRLALFLIASTYFFGIDFIVTSLWNCFVIFFFEWHSLLTLS